MNEILAGTVFIVCLVILLALSNYGAYHLTRDLPGHIDNYKARRNRRRFLHLVHAAEPAFTCGGFDIVVVCRSDSGPELVTRDADGDPALVIDPPPVGGEYDLVRLLNRLAARDDAADRTRAAAGAMAAYCHNLTALKE